MEPSFLDEGTSRASASVARPPSPSSDRPDPGCQCRHGRLGSEPRSQSSCRPASHATAHGVESTCSGPSSRNMAGRPGGRDKGGPPAWSALLTCCTFPMSKTGARANASPTALRDRLFGRLFARIPDFNDAAAQNGSPNSRKPPVRHSGKSESARSLRQSISCLSPQRKPDALGFIEPSRRDRTYLFIRSRLWQAPLSPPLHATS